MMVEDRAVTCVALGGTLDTDGPGDILDADVVSTCPVGNEEGTCDEAMVHPFCDRETLWLAAVVVVVVQGIPFGSVQYPLDPCGVRLEILVELVPTHWAAEQ